jgi:hypothetical protein
VAEEKKDELRITLDELKEVKRLYSGIRICQINQQQAAMAYQEYGTLLATRYGVQDELYNIDRLTGIINIMSGSLPGVGGGPQQ